MVSIMPSARPEPSSRKVTSWPIWRILPATFSPGWKRRRGGRRPRRRRTCRRRSPRRRRGRRGGRRLAGGKRGAGSARADRRPCAARADRAGRRRGEAVRRGAGDHRDRLGGPGRRAAGRGGARRATRAARARRRPRRGGHPGLGVGQPLPERAGSFTAGAAGSLSAPRLLLDRRLDLHARGRGLHVALADDDRAGFALLLVRHGARVITRR